MTTFWVFLVYLILGLIAVSFVPDKARTWLIVVLVLGGIVYVQKHGSIDDLLLTLEGKK